MSLIRASGLRWYRELLADLGVDPDPLLRRAGLNPTVAGDHEVFVSYRSVVEAIEAAAAVAGTPDFGRRLARRQGVDVLGPLTVAARTAPTVADALGICGSYLSAYSPAIAVTLTPTDDRHQRLLEFRIIASDIPPAPQTTELALGISLAMCRHLCGSLYQPVAVHLPHPPLTPVECYRDFYGGEPHFDRHVAALGLRTSDLGRSVSHDGQAHAVILRYLDGLRLPTDNGLADPVRRLVHDLIPSGAVSAELVARQFALHPKTLQRRLVREGTSFAAIVEQTRRQLAVHYLRDTDLSLGVVARELGYTEQSALSRSCTRWFGHAPSIVRTALRSDRTASA